MSTLEVKNLHVSIDNKEILKGVTFTLETGKMYAIMGPNGTGTSTLSCALMGDPRYTVTEGSVTLDGQDILSMSVDERSRAGLFLALQMPVEISGITNQDFIRAAMEARLEEGKRISLFQFIKQLEGAISDLKMNPDLSQRYLNEGFSGGEKKRNEILQMKLLKPKFAILDEIDSGLDVDALRIVSENVNAMRSPDFSALMITHYERLLDYIPVDEVIVLMNGKVVKTGGQDLIKKIDEEGYDWIKEELGLVDEPKKQVVSLGTCALNNHKGRK